MGQEDRRSEIATKRVVFELPGMDRVYVVRNVPYKALEDETLVLDVYRPAEPAPKKPPVVLFVTGYPDTGMRKMIGCNAKDMESYVSWARLVAASGMAGISCSVREPATDVGLALNHVRAHSAELGVDASRVGVWSCSGNVPNALSLLMAERQSVACAVLCYGFMLDFEGSTLVADASTTFRFANPSAGRTLDDLPRETPLFIARAGRDETPHLNETIDRFVAKAVERNLPLTLANLPDAPHAFDIVDDTDASRNVVRSILDFLKLYLCPPAPALLTGDCEQIDFETQR